jgi:CBS domain-containing protein
MCCEHIWVAVQPEESEGKAMRQTEFFMNACDPKTLTVGQLMQDAVTRCTSRTDALTLTHMMTHRNFGSMPVVEEDGTLVGIVSEYDLLQVMIEGRDLRKVLATEIMSAHPVTVTEDQTLVQVADLFQDRYLTRVPVVRNGKLVGILARRDLLFGYTQASQYWS